MLPMARNYTKPLILNRKMIEEFIKALLPGMSPEQMKDPSVSPFYEDLAPFRGRLPSALFTCGTDDALVDDSIGMATK